MKNKRLQVQPQSTDTTYLESLHNMAKHGDVKAQFTLGLRYADEVKAAIIAILDKHFPNGIRPNSPIDSSKLKRYYYEAMGEDILSVVPDVSALLDEIGVRHGDKVFAVTSSRQQSLSALFDRLLSEDNRLFYYDEFCNAHADFLQGMHIFSPELLRAVLSGIRPSWSFYKHYCLAASNVTVESEILRCYESAICLSYEQLKARLPYVPIANIKQVLAQNSDFVWVNQGVYTHISKIEIDAYESRAACAKVEETITSNGFASLAVLGVAASLELNPDLSETAVKNGLFQIYLNERYEKRGIIITKRGVSLSTTDVFRNYCLSFDTLLFDDLLAFEKEICGYNDMSLLIVAYETMVRVDKDLFVAERKICFDVESIDNALALFVRAEVVPLQAITSFTSFPYIDGYPWNLFLLESYCRRFSKRYKFQCLSVNSRNVGAIFRNEFCFTSYIDVLAYAVAQSNIDINIKAVGNFLFKNKYVAQRTSAVQKVLAKVRMLPARRG